MSTVNLIFFDLENKKPLISELKDYYKKNSDIEITSVKDANEANAFIKQMGSGVLIFKIVSKDDLTNAVTILKAQANLIKKGLFKPACIMQVNNKKLEKILLKYGCNELLDSEMRSKTMAYKIDFWTKNLLTVLKKAQNAQELKLKIKQEEGNTETTATNKVGTISVPSLKIKSDIWIVKNKADCKKILKKWLIRILGPGPTVGKWVEVATKNTKKYQLWEFQLNEEGAKFIYEPGSWFFTGSKPEFDWKANRWILTGEYVHLYFYNDAKETFSRFKLDINQLQVAENSKYALAKEEKILLTCDKKFEFSNDEVPEEVASHLEAEAAAVNKNQAMEGEFAHDAIDTSPLEGKGSASDQINGQLEGKGSASDQMDGHLKGKVNNDSEADADGSNESDFNEDDIEKYYNSKTKGKNDEDSGPLRGEIDNDGNGKKKKGQNKSEFEEDEIETHYGGKSKTDHLDDSPLEGKVSKHNKDQKKNNKSEFEEDEIETHYGGKSKTDHIDDSPLEGKTAKTNKAAKKDKRSEFEEDEIETHYGGKSKTDHLDDSPLEGKTEKTNKSAKKDNRSEFQEDEIETHYDGKSSTDHADNDPLSGKVAKNKNVAKSAKKSSFVEDEIEGHYDGENETDHIEDGPLSGKINKTANTKDAKKKSDFHEDAIDTHYDGDINNEDEEDDPLLPSTHKSKSAAKKNARGLPIPLMENDGVDDESEIQDDEEFDPLIPASKNNKAKPASQDDIKQDIELFDDEPLLNSSNKQTKNKQGRSDHIPEFDPMAENELEDEADSPDLNSIVIGKKNKTETSDDPLDLSTIIDNKKQIKKSANNKASSDDDVLNIKKKDNKSIEDEIDEVLSGDLTKNSKKRKDGSKAATDESDEDDTDEDLKNKLDFNKKIGRKNEKEDKKPDLATIIGEEPKINLESGEVRVLLEQETDKGNKISFACKFDDLFEKELIVLAPKNSLVAETDVLVTMALRYSGKKALVKAKGKISVVDVNDADKDWDILTVILSEVDESKIKGFMSLYSERQDSINEFMTLAKGY